MQKRTNPMPRQAMDGLNRYRDVRYWHLADIPSCTAHVCFSGVKRKLVRTCLVTCARIWREIFKLVGLDRFHRTFRLTHPAIDAFLGMNDEHIFALVETIDGAHLDAIH